MRYATPTRSAHRATPAGGLALLVRHPGPIGQHRYHPGVRTRPQRHARRDPRETAHLLTRGLAGLIVLGICVMLGVLIVADERRSPAAAAGGTPLTAAEVFPAGSAAFQVGRTDLSADCTVAVTGTLRSTLQRYGCAQAVRAALTVPYADLRITAGVLSLADTTAAATVADLLRSLVESGDGGFAGMAGEETGLGTPVVWRTHGHYLTYCIITGPNGELVPGDDPRVQRIATDLLDTHFSSTVLPGRR
ncbi:hypothetical protein AB0F81_11285 [Actinoplanes sp. NPDC024001]|uniref:hypothetical protein n=1 Tax=Actinoplanes sp. NPDC024001 TaxID=3154598 RepID=UPI00340CFC84